MSIEATMDELPAIGPGVALLRALERGGSGLDAIPEWELSTISWKLFSWAQEVRDQGNGSERELLLRVLQDDPTVALEISDGQVRTREQD
jgi:hypothetical protein